MCRRPTISTLTATLFPYTTLFRSRQFRLVAGAEHHRTELVRHRHQGEPAGARLNVLLRGVRITTLEDAGEHHAEGLHRRPDRDGVADRKSTRLNSSH